MLRSLKAILVFIIILQSMHLVFVEAKATVDYSFDTKSVIIKLETGINQEDRPLILEVYLNRSIFRVYYFNDSFPQYININVSINGPTFISVRTYNSLSGWGKMNEIYVTPEGISSPKIDLSREIALIIGVILLFSAFLIYFKGIKGSK